MPLAPIVSVPDALSAHAPRPLDERRDDRHLDHSGRPAERDHQPEHDERNRVADQVAEAGVQERRGEDARQAGQRAR